MKKNIVAIILSLLLVAFPFTYAFADVNYTGVPVLLYHHLIQDGEESSSVLKKSTFEMQMKYLYDNGYTTISLNRLEDYIDGKIKLPAKSVVITFDDGYRSNYEIAYPILKKYGFRASQFVITSAIQDHPEVTNNDRLPHMSSGEMQLVKDVFEFHSHTNDLHKLDSSNKSLAIASSPALVKSDLILANSSLTTIGFPPFAIAYPYGMYSDELKQNARESGLKMGFTIVPARASVGVDKFEIPRYNISEKTTFEDFKNIVDPDPEKIMIPATLNNSGAIGPETPANPSGTITITSIDPNTGKTISYEVLVDQTTN